MPNKYPTKAEILTKIDKFEIDKEHFKLLSGWKTVFWKKNDNQESKVLALSILVDMLTKNKVITTYEPGAHTCCFVRVGQIGQTYVKIPTIVINKSLSILSTLHEVGHYFHGDSELKACLYSIKLFKKVFPKAFKKLKWDGHMLKKIN